jgi:hypothetical protein
LAAGCPAGVPRMRDEIVLTFVIGIAPAAWELSLTHPLPKERVIHV